MKSHDCIVIPPRRVETEERGGRANNNSNDDNTAITMITTTDHASEQKPTIFGQSENERLNCRVPEPPRTEAVEPEWSSAGSDRVSRSERWGLEQLRTAGAED